MKANRLVIHEINKKEHKDPLPPLFSETTVTIADNSIETVTELNDRYKNAGEARGAFNTSQITHFQEEFDKYIIDQTDATFIEFSKKVVGKLHEILKLTTPAKGGYLVFADYESYGKFMGVFLIRNKKGTAFNRNIKTNSFIINDSIHIDYEHLAMACRINKESYHDNADSYLTFINRKNTDSKFFCNWVGATELTKDTENSKTLLKILKNIDTPVDENNKPMDRTEFLTNVKSHVSKSPNKNEVDIRELGTFFYKDPKKVVEYANKNEMPISTSFKLKPEISRRFTNVIVKADKIELSFPIDYLEEEKIVILEDNISVVIHSEKLTKQIQEQKNITAQENNQND